MPEINCPNCQGTKRTVPITIDCHTSAQMDGIVKCLMCNHEIPITIKDGRILKLDTTLPSRQSNGLHSSVPPDIKEDVQEAERAHYSQCYKASTTMCRRALQLSLIDKGVTDKALSSMLQEAKNSGLLTIDTYNLATSIKGYGDIGAHRKDIISPKEVELVIYCAVRILNELFK